MAYAPPFYQHWTNWSFYCVITSIVWLSATHPKLIPWRTNNNWPSIDYYEWLCHPLISSTVRSYLWRVYVTVEIKSVAVGRVKRGVILQGAFCIENCMAGMWAVVSSKWSLNKSERMSQFDCILTWHRCVRESDGQKAISNPSKILVTVQRTKMVVTIFKASFLCKIWKLTRNRPLTYRWRGGCIPGYRYKLYSCNLDDSYYGFCVFAENSK